MFKLLIECTKDIESLSINFSDGTSVVTESDKIPPSGKSPDKEQSNNSFRSYKDSSQGELLDTDVDFDSIKNEIIQKPEITQTNREAKVASELQNLDI